MSNDISVKKAYEKMQNDKDIVVLDVRTPCERKREYVKGSISVDFRDEEFEKKTMALDKNGRYIVYCHGGGRSKRASDRMKELGFQNVENMIGGINEWEECGYAVVRP